MKRKRSPTPCAPTAPDNALAKPANYADVAATECASALRTRPSAIAPPSGPRLDDPPAQSAISNPQSEIPNPQFDLPSLSDSAERAALARLVVLCSDPETPPELFCKLAHVFCEIKKQNNAAAKTAAVLELGRAKTAAMLEIGRDKLAAMLELAKAKARRRPRRDSDDSDPDPDGPAPYGRKSDGSPYTEAEFRSALDAAVADLYGLSAPDENRPAPLIPATPLSESSF